MSCNVGKTDKWIRIGLGIVLILIGAFYQSWWGAVGLVPLLTGIVNYCPLYPLIKADTRSTEEKTKE
ncbi:MAG: YgaP family membrane protein [Wolinella sp.]